MEKRTRKQSLDKRRESSQKRRVSAQNTRTSVRTQNYASKSAPGSAAMKKKRKSGIKIGKYRIKPKLIVGLCAIVIVIGVIIGVSSREPSCFDLNKSSITMIGDTEAIIIKNEMGYSYPEGSTLVSRVPDGTYVNVGDTIAVIRTEGFVVDWYTKLEIARRETIDFILSRVGNNDILKNALDEIDRKISSVKSEMTKVISFAPEKYGEYSAQLEALYEGKRDTALAAFKNDNEIDAYLKKEEGILDRIKAYTQEVKAMKEGIVSYNADGYANVYNYDSIDSVTETVYNNIREDKCTTSIKNSRKASDYYISDMTKCYIAMHGTEGTFKYLALNDETIIRINNGSLQYIASVRKIDSNAGGVYLIIEPTGNFAELYRDRELSISVQKTWTGLVIPKDHIVKKKDKRGVYIYENKKKTFGGESNE